eukprot:1137842-Pelagomonas_calceolata.AAC.3
MACAASELVCAAPPDWASIDFLTFMCSVLFCRDVQQPLRFGQRPQKAHSTAMLLCNELQCSNAPVP